MYTIVIVEDEELERQALRRIIEENIEDARVIGEARTGTEAVKLIDGGDIDLMLVDINIPKINGLDVIRHLRGRHPETKVIITTAYDYFEMTRTAIQLKADEYLLKPIRPQILVDTVRTCLRQLGGGRRSRDMVRQMAELVDKDAYCESVSLLRRHTEAIYGQRDTSPRDLILDTAEALSNLARQKRLDIPEPLARRIDGLKAVQVSGSTRLQVFDTFLGIVNLLFDVTGERANGPADTIQKALNYIERNLNRGVRLEEVADHVEVSACYLSRLFKKTLSINFVAYLTSRRIELAKELLAGTELPVTNIATELAYNGVNYFCKSFKKEVGMSPSGYRQRARPMTGTVMAQYPSPARSHM